MCDDALRAEVSELRAEVESLRTWQAVHMCAPVPSYWPTPCTCGTSSRCLVHYPADWQSRTVSTPVTGDPAGGWFQNMMGAAAGAAGGNYSYPQALTFQCAGPGPVFTFSAGA